MERRPMRGSGDEDVGLREVAAFEEERLPGLLREGVGEAVAEVEAGGMAAFAEATKGLAGYLGLLLVERDYFHFELNEKRVQERSRSLGSSAHEYERSFHQRRCGYKAYRAVRHSRIVEGCIRLLQNDCYERRCIDDHYSGIPSGP